MPPHFAIPDACSSRRQIRIGTLMIAIAVLAVGFSLARAFDALDVVSVVVISVTAVATMLAIVVAVLAIFGFFAALAWLGFLLVGAVEWIARCLRKAATWPDA